MDHSQIEVLLTQKQGDPSKPTYLEGIPIDRAGNARFHRDGYVIRKKRRRPILLLTNMALHGE